MTRRDGEALVLMSQREAEGRTRLLEFAALFIGVAVDNDGPLAERMSRAFPWMLALSPKDRSTCAHDLVDGFGGHEVTVDLTIASGEDFEVERNP